ncbi:hypothetical protein BGZ63DRAFT_400806 [Mariannaea sp. PMI_226]|nr:hypothetical protein BGZ63DRAFT_400806 [Mariannaea sp. PMI_226]
MDPMDYVLHNQPRSSAAQYDPVHAVTGSWAPPPLHQPSPAFPWPHGPPSYHHHLLPVPVSSSSSFQPNPNGGLPPPFPGFPTATDFSGPMPRHMPIPYSLASTSSRFANPVGAAHDDAFANQVPGGRPLSFQPPVGSTMPPTASNSELNHSLPRPPLPVTELSVPGFAQHHNSPPFPFPLPGTANAVTSTPPRRSHYSSSSHSPRTSREVPSPTRISQSTSGPRRPHPRARRSLSRFAHHDSAMDDDDEPRRHPLHSDASLDQQIMDEAVRQYQLARGFDFHMVASKMTLQSLQSVNIEDLEGEDKICVICYNEFGTETPEGINEAPLRLPKCKHIFGDHCIKKWFETSDNCPYCRDKVHSEPKPSPASTRAFMNMMRLRGIERGPRILDPNDPLVRAMTATFEAEPGSSTMRQHLAGGRRSPPDDIGEQQRRTRPRHGNPGARDSSPPSRPNSFEQSSSESHPIPSTSEGNATSSMIPRASQRNMAPRPLHRRWQSSTLAGTSTVTAPETTRRNVTAQPSTSMSPSAPVFHPRGTTLENRTVSNDSSFPSNTTSSMISSPIPNPLHSPGEMTQSRRQLLQQQQNAANGSRIHNSNRLEASTQALPPGQNINRNRPW